MEQEIWTVENKLQINAMLFQLPQLKQTLVKVHLLLNSYGLLSFFNYVFIYLFFTLNWFFIEVYSWCVSCVLSCFSLVHLIRHYGLWPSRLLWILQARILEWVAMPCSRGSSWPRDGTHVSTSPALAGRIFTTSTHSWFTVLCKLQVYSVAIHKF